MDCNKCYIRFDTLFCNLIFRIKDSKINREQTSLMLGVYFLLENRQNKKHKQF